MLFRHHCVIAGCLVVSFVHRYCYMCIDVFYSITL